MLSATWCMPPPNVSGKSCTPICVIDVNLADCLQTFL